MEKVPWRELRVFCSGWLNSLPPKERHDVGIRLGSSVWGVVSTTWAAVLLLPRWWDTVYGHPVGRLYADPPFETCNLLFAAAIGYFLWDLATTLYYGYGAEYVFHAVISIMVYAVPKLMPPSFLQFYGCFFILWEVSLPFVNVRHVLIKAGMANTFLFNFVQFMGFGLFLFIRLLVGLPIIIRYAMDVWELHKAGRMERAPVYLLFVVGGFAFQCINFFWIYAIYKSVFKKRGDKGSSSETLLTVCARAQSL